MRFAGPAESRLSGSDPVSRFIAVLIDRAIHVAPALEPMRRAAEMLARFVGVGGISSALYAVLVALAVSWFHIHHDLATLVAFLLVTPINFVMHRVFTFHSRGVVREDLLRYLLLQVTGFAVCLLIMSISVDVFGMPYAVGIVGAVVLVPLVSFLVMDRWVFAAKSI